MKLAPFLVGCLLMQAAHAKCGRILMPPAEWDHAPASYKVVMVQHMDLDQLQAYCAAKGITPDPRETVWACTFHPGQAYVITLPTSGGLVEDWQIACLLRHELAHVNGWPANHPGVRYE